MSTKKFQEQLHQAESDFAGLQKKAEMLGDRLRFLRSEQAGLAWPVSTGDKEAQARLAVVESEIGDIANLINQNTGDTKAAAQQAEALKYDLAASELHDDSAERDRYALEEAKALLEIIGHHASIRALQDQAEAARTKAHALNISVTGRGGADQTIGWPIGSAERQKVELGARVSELEARK